jgi:hypothetical protein
VSRRSRRGREAGRREGEAGRRGGEAGRREGEAGGRGGEAGRRGGEAGRRGRGSAAGRAEATAGRPSADVSHRAPSASGWGLGVQITFLAAVFGVVVLIAELAGAANLGVALGIGQIGFAIAVMYLLLRR